MTNQKHQNKFNITKIYYLLRPLASLFLVVVFSSSTAFAEQATFAISCPVDNSVAGHNNYDLANVNSKGDVSCSAPNETATIQIVGPSSDNNPNDTVVVVNCGNSNLAKNYKAGDAISKFACQHGTPSVVTTSTNGSPGTGGQGSSAPTPALCADANSSNQALCPYCSQNNPSSGCISPSSDSAVTCNGSQCDLIAKYLNPFIGLLTGVFGLIAAASIIYGGISFATSEGDPQKAGKAKQRIFNTIFAVIAYIFLYAFLQFIVPGGVFK